MGAARFVQQYAPLRCFKEETMNASEPTRCARADRRVSGLTTPCGPGPPHFKRNGAAWPNAAEVVGGVVGFGRRGRMRHSIFAKSAMGQIQLLSQPCSSVLYDAEASIPVCAVYSTLCKVQFLFVPKCQCDLRGRLPPFTACTFHLYAFHILNPVMYIAPSKPHIQQKRALQTERCRRM